MGLMGDKVDTHAADANRLADLEGWGTPSQEHNTLTSLTVLRRDASRRDSPQDGGRESFPALLRVRVCLVGSNGQASVQPQDALFGDFGEIADGYASQSITLPERRRRSDPCFGISKPDISDATCL